MKNNENISKIAIAKPQLQRHKVKLKIGNWKNHFDLNYVNTIIAMALSDFDDNISFDIKGYLITSQNLYLVVQTTEKSIEKMVHKIEIKIIFLLKNNPQKLKENRRETSFIADDENFFYEARKPLFKIYPLENGHLVKLITGEKVTLPYFDRDLKELKALIHNHPFCSAIHYLGGIDPVEMEEIKDSKKQ
ncbi:hypothetical protein [Flavobacterium pectinovorum]|uniref:Uncharacterized protein n=1 Tax=Flavobacterium pectinovorum TaxID=29533 RepID=A0A502EVS3_9FLAO|nr:hypothetical protein [Flavobacterium pectinovorum]TPG40829.1 hypothetical protein EAH81_10830 [Flavobacterium pectinovorum]